MQGPAWRRRRVVIASNSANRGPGHLYHGVIFEPDPDCLPVIEEAFASLYWRTISASSLTAAGEELPGAWAAVLALESGDIDALEVVGRLKHLAPATVFCVLVDELNPDFDGMLKAAGVEAVFAKPVQQAEIVEALVAGFMARRH